jgi:HEAT repeat protein
LPIVPRLWLVVALWLALQAERAAQAQPISSEAVVALLSGIEDVPARAEWEAMGPTVIPVLARIVTDHGHPGFIRLRAIQVAGAFATPQGRALLRRALRDREPLLVREAVLALERAFGSAALPDIAPLLAHPDTAVREAAILALGSMGTEAARMHLRRRLDREPDEVLREEIQRVLRVRPTTGSRGGTEDTNPR